MIYTIDKQKVREKMRLSGIKTQQELADKLNMSKNQLSVLLSPKFNPIKSNALKLCEALDVVLEDIITYEQIEFDLEENQIMSHNPTKGVMGELPSCVDIHTVQRVRVYTGVELFAGAGGLALGLEHAGFDTLGLVEIDKHACQTLRYNRPKWNVIEADVVRVAEEGISGYLTNISDGELDLLSGGYPCQAFSYAGKKLGLDDVRGTMFYNYAKILDELKPKMFLAENVKGLVNHDEGKTLQTMLDVFEEIGYDVQWKILNALDFNVAQKRERIVIVGIRRDLVKKYDVQYRFPQPLEQRLVLRDILQNVPESQGMRYPDSKKAILDLVPPGGYWRDLPNEIAKEYMGKSYYSGGGRTGMARRLSWDEPSLTLTCSPAQKQTERCHPDETRPFTVREYARIQSFPDEWGFPCSMNNAYKQIGNAVPVNLAKAIGLSIIDTLNQLK